MGAEAAGDLPRPLAQLRRHRPLERSREIVHRAFEPGITHFDLANNYGPPYGSAEETFGQILRKDLAGHRDEIVVSTKARWDMWPGPYGDGAAPPRQPRHSSTGVDPKYCAATTWVCPQPTYV